jgi:hypothetical protein
MFARCERNRSSKIAAVIDDDGLTGNRIAVGRDQINERIDKFVGKHVFLDRACAQDEIMHFRPIIATATVSFITSPGAGELNRMRARQNNVVMIGFCAVHA